QAHNNLRHGQPFAVQIQVPRAKQAHSRWWFFFNPRYLTFSKPKMRFRMRNRCSTFARTRALTRFFAFRKLGLVLTQSLIQYLDVRNVTDRVRPCVDTPSSKISLLASPSG